mmetsp:Transcript_22590/g.63552  ORF Transcript_22590/g.63552 Transcript_22590/m.63552 type:complete len:236 (-) Transcript_22590:20-727(-)
MPFHATATQPAAAPIAAATATCAGNVSRASMEASPHRNRVATDGSRSGSGISLGGAGPTWTDASRMRASCRSAASPPKPSLRPKTTPRPASSAISLSRSSGSRPPPASGLLERLPAPDDLRWHPGQGAYKTHSGSAPKARNASSMSRTPRTAPRYTGSCRSCRGGGLRLRPRGPPATSATAADSKWSGTPSESIGSTSSEHSGSPRNHSWNIDTAIRRPSGLTRRSAWGLLSAVH